MKTSPRLFLAAMCLSVCLCGRAFGQAEATGWGNLTGIRVDGQLMRFGTSLRVVSADWSQWAQTANERVSPRFSRNGPTQTISATLANLQFTEAIEDTAPGIATIDVQFSARAAVEMAGAFLCVELPGADYAGGTVQLIEPTPPAENEYLLSPTRPEGQNEYLRATAKGIRLISPRRQLEVTFSAPTEVFVRDDRRQGITDVLVYLAVMSGNASAGQAARTTFTLKPTGVIDREPIMLVLDTSRPGRALDGIGGNFRLQNATADPPAIQYNLENLPVRWGRVEMPWSSWHPNENTDPIEAARVGQLAGNVQQAMEMARTLAQRAIPVIASDWSPPGWAIRGGGGRGGFGGGPGGLRGQPLDPDKMDAICKSIGDYFVYMKQAYGVEAAMFSFNESDLGINVRQTGEEHAALIKTLGAHLASRGLATKLLLGDTSDATAIEFIQPAINDPETHKYIGAVSFHSWRGGPDELLARWGDAATKLNVPLLVGEGSIDAAAWNYPAIFLEPAYALDEIRLYMRICRLCQPRSILQWQLTSDYSILTGGAGGRGRRGGTAEPLRPTQRFWDLKQLGASPKGAFWMPLACDRPLVTAAACGDVADGVYAVHLLNDGASRPATLTGLPAGVKQARVYVTDASRGMAEIDPVTVADGTAKFTLEAAAFTTLICGP